VVLDVTEEDVIVEFGNNKNCRIPMRKMAIAEVEKADAAVETKTDTDKDKKSVDLKKK
jgi:preprotein translocase subunit YajC